MVYVDASVALAALFGETKRPDDAFWALPCVASRVTELEVRVRASSITQAAPSVADVDRLIAAVSYVEVAGPALSLLYTGGARGLRTLDAIHLSTLAYLNSGPQQVILATYDRRLAAAARAMRFEVVEP